MKTKRQILKRINKLEAKRDTYLAAADTEKKSSTEQFRWLLVADYNHEKIKELRWVLKNE